MTNVAWKDNSDPRFGHPELADYCDEVTEAHMDELKKLAEKENDPARKRTILEEVAW